MENGKRHFLCLGISVLSIVAGTCSVMIVFAGVMVPQKAIHVQEQSTMCEITKISAINLNEYGEKCSDAGGDRSQSDTRPDKFGSAHNDSDYVSSADGSILGNRWTANAKEAKETKFDVENRVAKASAEIKGQKIDRMHLRSVTNRKSSSGMKSLEGGCHLCVSISVRYQMKDSVGMNKEAAGVLQTDIGVSGVLPTTWNQNVRDYSLS